jgi:hypothetical protein
MIKWLYKPSGACPVQAEGYFLGYWFYFRSRGTQATILFSKIKEDYLGKNHYKYYVLWEGSWPDAGWLNHNKCKQLICKGLRRLKKQIKI